MRRGQVWWQSRVSSQIARRRLCAHVLSLTINETPWVVLFPPMRVDSAPGRVVLTLFDYFLVYDFERLPCNLGACARTFKSGCWCRGWHEEWDHLYLDEIDCERLTGITFSAIIFHGIISHSVISNGTIFYR